MQKFQGLILTLLVSFFTLFICELESTLAIKDYVAKHELQDNHGINTAAITIDTSLEVPTNLEDYKNQPTVNHFYANTSLNKLFLEPSTSYLKTCDFFDFSQIIGVLIFPFHSFL